MRRTPLLLLIAVAGSVSAQGTTLVVYPAKGQDNQQKATDTIQCQDWARNETGFNPSAPPPAQQAAPQQRGGVVRGATRGAIAGEIIDDDAGKGAAIGGLVGGMRQASRNTSAQQSAQASNSAAMGQYNAQRDSYLQALRLCLESRGYTVK
jgi:hypothetical protein